MSLIIGENLLNLKQVQKCLQEELLIAPVI